MTDKTALLISILFLEHQYDPFCKTTWMHWGLPIGFEPKPIGNSRRNQNIINYDLIHPSISTEQIREIVHSFSAVSYGISVRVKTQIPDPRSQILLIRDLKFLIPDP